MASVYLGIDPGLGGGLAVLDGNVRRLVAIPETPEDTWHWLQQQVCQANGLPRPGSYAVIEQQIPRPTSWINKATGQYQSSILKSTCLLYGNYQLLLGMLTALGISYEVVTAKDWQEALSIPQRVKGEKPTKHKNRLKTKAQALYPRAGVTLATCDALLLAHYARLKHEGKLLAEAK